MNIPQLDINFSMGQIGMEWNKGSMEIKQNTPQIDLDYSGSKPYQIVPDLKISNPPAELDIDNSKPLAELGFRKIHSLIDFMESKSKRKTLENLQEISRDGDYLGKLELGGERISQLSKSKMLEEIPEVNVALLPENPPEINVKVNPVKIDITETDIKVKNNFVFPKAEIKPDQLKIYLAQKGELEIELVKHVIDMKV